MENMFEEIRALYNAMYDEKSKKYFIDRLSKNITGKGNYMLDMIRDNCQGIDGYTIADYYESQKNNPQQKLIVYGAFNSGLIRYYFNKSLGLDDIFCFCDKNPALWESGYCGKKVISPEELVEKYKDYYVLIETKYYYQEVYDFLIASGFEKDHIVLHCNQIVQYFTYEYLNFSDDEVFVDGGCFDCESTIDFIHRVGGKYNKIIAFEPDSTNLENCRKIIEKENLQNVDLINAGLWNRNTSLSFENYENDTSCSRIVEDSDANSIRVVAIDEACKGEKVSFIKMDIEGSELKALHGAENTIKNNKPKLAICIYHKPEDITEIQRYLMSIVPEYKFGIRHYADHEFETVLYAFI